jgi:SAM-dependent methyltransferase
MNIKFYRQNATYSESLRKNDPRSFQTLPTIQKNKPFHQKYITNLTAGLSPANVKILDVGCGAGQTLAALTQAGYEAHGVEVSETSLSLARQASLHCRLYDGTTLPYENNSFAAVGAFNVLEHTENPLAFLEEIWRVTKPGGRVVISSPNFWRFLGWQDYHPHMRGLSQKCSNLQRTISRTSFYAKNPEICLFDHLQPISRTPAQPDDDATVATNPIDISQFFRTKSCSRLHVSCVDRPIPRWLEWVLDLTLARHGLFNVFIVAEKLP